MKNWIKKQLPKKFCGMQENIDTKCIGALCCFFFSVYFQADEESRRNQLMRDMAQLRLQVREGECWLISVVKSKGSEMTNQRWNGFIGVHVMVNNFHFLSTNKTSDFMWFWRIIYNSKRTEVSTDATIGIFNCPSICRHMT